MEPLQLYETQQNYEETTVVSQHFSEPDHNRPPPKKTSPIHLEKKRFFCGVFVCLCLLHIKYQNPHCNRKVGPFWPGPHNSKGLFEG